MGEKKTSTRDQGLPMVILVFFALAGGVYGVSFSNVNGGFIYGLFLGLLIGVAVLATVEYASIKIRRN